MSHYGGALTALSWRSHGVLKIAVRSQATPWERHGSAVRSHRTRQNVEGLRLFCACSKQTPSLGVLIRAPYDRHSSAVRSPTTPWERRGIAMNAVEAPWDRIQSPTRTPRRIAIERSGSTIATPWSPWERSDNAELYSIFTKFTIFLAISRRSE